MAQSADPLRERAAAAQRCFERLCPPAERQRRAAVAREMVLRLSDYRSFLGDLEADGPCGGLRRQLADRAFEAEGHLRILLAEGLKCVNDLRDSGWLHTDSAGRQRIYVAPNLLEEPGALEVPGWWLKRMLQRRDASGFRPAAFFHSHLTTLEPSAADCAAMRHLTLPWIILRLEAGHLIWSEHHAVGDIEANVG